MRIAVFAASLVGSWVLAEPAFAQTVDLTNPGEDTGEGWLCEAALPLLRSEHKRDGREVKVRRGEVELILSLDIDGNVLSATYKTGYALQDGYQYVITVDGVVLNAKSHIQQDQVVFQEFDAFSELAVLTQIAILSVSTTTAKGTTVSDYFTISPLSSKAACSIDSGIFFVRDSGAPAKSPFVPTDQKTLAEAAVADDSHLSFDEFEKCYNEGGAFYRERCFGRDVKLTGFVSNYSSDGVLLTLRRTCGGERIFNVDVKNLRSDFFAANEDKCLQATVTIGSANFMTPDVTVKSVDWIESDLEKSDRLAEKERMEIEARQRDEEERRRAQIAKMEQLEANKADAEWLNENYYGQSQVACRQAVEALAKWDFEWTDKWYEEKFTSYLVRTKAPYVVTILGDSIKMQNGFGAWQRVSYACDYNAKLDRASAYLR